MIKAEIRPLLYFAAVLAIFAETCGGVCAGGRRGDRTPDRSVVSRVLYR